MFTAVECVVACANDPTCLSADYNLDGGHCYFHMTSFRNCGKASLQQDSNSLYRIVEVYHFKKITCRKYLNVYSDNIFDGKMIKISLVI